MSSSHQKAAQMLGAAADLLDQGQIINRLSLAVTAIALGVLLLPVFPASQAMVPAAIATAIAGLVELACALRVSLDAALFRRLGNDASEDRLDVPAFDSALVALKLMPTGKAGWPIARRLAGARRLLIFQMVALLVQVLFAFSGGLSVFFELI
jgi:hypothetical protein